MNNKTFIFSLLCGVVVLLTWLYGFQDNTQSITQKKQVALINGFSDKASSITQITINSPKSEDSIEKVNDQWVWKQKDNYPVTKEKIFLFFQGLEKAKLNEKKTKSEKGLIKLGLKKSEAHDLPITLTLRSKESVIFSAIFGKQNYVGNNQVRLYYLDQNDQSWSVYTNTKIEFDIQNWLDTVLFKVDKNKIKKAEIKIDEFGTSVLTLIKKNNSTDFQIEGLSPQWEVKTQYSINHLAGVIDGLEFSDVKKAKSFKAQLTSFGEANYELDNGSIIHLTLFKGKEEKEIWVTIKQSNQLNEDKFNSWIFRLDNWASEQFLKKYTDLVQKKTN